MKKLLLILLIFSSLFIAPNALAHQPNLVFSQQGEINIYDPEISRAFYDDLKGQSRNYIIDSNKDFELYINLLVPDPENRNSKYSANIFFAKGESASGGNIEWEKIFSVSGEDFIWQSYYEEFGRDYYLKGPELKEEVKAGKYRIEVYSKENQGKYVLAVGEIESFDIKTLLNVYWKLPLLKLTFFKTSVLQFFLTPFGIGAIGLLGGLIIFITLIYYIVGLIRQFIKHNQAKTLLLTSGGMPQMQDEVIKLLQKPAYDVTVAFVNTAYRYKAEDDQNYKNVDLQIMRDLGFNVEEIDIEGKTQNQIMKLFELKDIIFVAGGNTFYLLNAMRRCNFEKVIRNLLKSGKVYIGVSAGSIVAGQTIKPAGWLGDTNLGMKNLKGLGLVPFDIFVHYTPEWAEMIKKQIKNPKKRLKKLKILTDDQAILVQGKEVDLIGEGEAVVI